MLADMPALYRNPPRCRVLGTFSYTIPDNAIQFIDWNLQAYDSAGMWSPADPMKMHVVQDGLYHLSYAGWWEDVAAGSRRITIHKFPTGGSISTIADHANVEGSSVRQVGSMDVELSAGEYIAMAVRPRAAGEEVTFRAWPGTTPSMSLRWVAPKIGD